MAERLATRRLSFEVRELALVALGAMPGALLRWQSSVQLGPFLGGNAGADLLVNLVGSFILGFLAGPIPRRTSLLLLVGIGFCGSLTTFSSWMLDVAKLIQAGRSSSGLLLIAASLALGLLCALAGLWLSRRVFRRTAG
ncbi:MAG: FluC/FEX family fluoride channel [Vulcanococcus sp.]